MSAWWQGGMAVWCTVSYQFPGHDLASLAVGVQPAVAGVQFEKEVLLVWRRKERRYD